MSFEKLKSDVEYLAGKNHTPIQLGECAYLPPESPAQLAPAEDGVGFIVWFSPMLVEPELTEALAHELGHALVHFQGLVDVYTLFPYHDLHPYLELEINNAMSHKPLIDILHDTYGIGSRLHLERRGNGVAKLRQDAMAPDLEQEQRFGIGVALYDVWRTHPDKKLAALEAADHDEDVRRAFVAAREHLDELTLGLPQGAQKRAVRMFLGELGIEVW